MSVQLDGAMKPYLAASTAGHVLLLVVLVYFAAQVLLFCAEVIKVTERHQHRSARLDP